MASKNNSYHHGSLASALLEEAASMIAEGGAESVTMRELGKRLGVSRAAPYRHFSDKSALLVAVAAAGFTKLGEQLRTLEHGEGEPGVEHIRRMGEAYVRFALENPAHYRLMYGREALAREELPELREAANTLFDGLARAFEACQAAGEIKQQDPRHQAYMAWGAVHGLASLLVDGQIMAEVDVNALIDFSTRALIDGLGG